jgi:ribosomal protein L11 methyltransferase
MTSPDTMLYIYEIRGIFEKDPSEPPQSFLGAWNEEEFFYLFFTEEQDEYVHEHFSSQLNGRHEMTYGDWQQGLPSDGVDLGGIRFVPPLSAGDPSPSVILDPSVVFGDGSHPTTVSCLNFIRKVVFQYPIQTMLDLGTGSGILSLAAAAMGVTSITAIDLNKLAVRVARENVERNGFISKIRILEGEARIFVNDPFDLVAANLPFHVLTELVPLRGLSFHKAWIVSGINEAQGTVLKELFHDQGYEILEEAQDPPWTTFLAVNKSGKLAG